MTSTPETRVATGDDAARPRIPAPAAIVAAFAVVAVTNALFIALLRRVPRIVRVWHHVFDAGHWLFVGAVVALVAVAWTRLGPKGPRWAHVARGVVGVAGAVAFSRDDYAGFASDAGGEVGGKVILAGLLLAAGLSPALLFGVARWLSSRHVVFAIASMAAGVGLAAANDLLLVADYPGVHLFVGLDAVALLVAGLGALPLPRRLQRETSPRFAPLALGGLALVAAPTVIIRPSNEVRTQLTRVDGSIVVPLLAHARWEDAVVPASADVPPELAPWFVARTNGRAIRPSGPSLLPERPIVLLVGIDSLRADLFDDPAARKKMPNLLALRQRALDFRMARSPGSRTITTWSQVFSGRYLSGLRWRGDGNRLSIADDRTKRFSDFLQERGVRTTAFVSYSALGKPGLARTFDEVIDVKGTEGQSFGLSADVVPKMLDLVATPHDGARFVFAHLMDPHYPYDAAVKSGSNRSRFLAEIGLADASIGKLVEGLEANHLTERTIVVLTADHGEGLGEHDTPHHTVNLYEELIRVPLFIVIPGVKPRVIETPVSLMDLGPTMLDLFSIPTPASFLGESLLPFARGKDPVLTRPIAAERHGTRTIVFGNRKVIVDAAKGRREIYDLDTDPEELTNRADELGAEGEKLAGLVQSFFTVHAIP